MDNDNSRAYYLPARIALRIARYELLKESQIAFTERFKNLTKSSLARYETGESKEIPANVLEYCYNLINSYQEENQQCPRCKGTGKVLVPKSTIPVHQLRTMINNELWNAVYEYMENKRKKKFYMSLQQIAQEFGVSRERIRQIKEQILSQK